MRIEDGNGLIRDLIETREPFFVGRLGSLELNVLKTQGRWMPALKRDISNVAGFYPANDQMLNEFCGLMHVSLGLATAMASWPLPGEEDILDRYCAPMTPRIPLRSLEPYYHVNPWSSALEGKRVLLVHPFDVSIQEQYTKRETLFENPKILPEFDSLLTVRAKVSLAGERPKDCLTWFDALESMKTDIRAIQDDFEIAILGCGAYGFPLAGWISRYLKKQAIHMAGSTQILFGIKGKRWDVHPEISALYNDNWVRPRPDETPANTIIVEGGSYW